MTPTSQPEPKPIPENYRDLVDRPLLMTLATILPDGTPQVTPVWFNYEDGYIFFNTARGRMKDRAIRKNPNVALLILDPDNEGRWLAIRGPVVAISEHDAREHIHLLARRYTGAARFGGPATETRVKMKVLPVHVTVASNSMPDKS
jgi:PPOX class probable F420-dependent enzyme